MESSSLLIPEQKILITKLPTEILFDIFSLVATGNPCHDDRCHNLYWGCICNPAFIRDARLVCRLFHELASPHLFERYRGFKINLSQKSLDRFANLAKNTYIASGIKSINILLDYRPAELANDLSRFTRYRIGQLREIYSDWINQKHEHELRSSVTSTYETLERAWGEFLSPSSLGSESPGTPIIDGPNNEQVFRELLLNGHEEYKRLHREQHDLITSGAFINSIASTIACIERGMTVCIIDSVEQPFHLKSHPSNWWESEEIAILLTWCMKWRAIEHLEGGAVLFPARIVSELPIAIHKAALRTGIPLLETYEVLECFPTSPHTDMGCIEPRLNSWNWEDLAEACSHLRSFAFTIVSGNHVSHQRVEYTKHINLNGISRFSSYFAAVLRGSASTLESLTLLFGYYSVHLPRSFIRAGWFLSSVTALPRLETLQITCIEVKQAEFEQFCEAVGASSRLKEINLREVVLHGQSWAGAIESLRKGVRHRQKGVELNIKELYGGELGYYEIETPEAKQYWKSRFKRLERETERAEGSSRLEELDPESDSESEIDDWEYERVWPIMRHIRAYLEFGWRRDLQNPLLDEDFRCLPLIPGRVRRESPLSITETEI